MKKLAIRSALLGLVGLVSAAAFADDSAYYQIKKIEVREVASDSAVEIKTPVFSSESSRNATNPGEQLDEIINIGKKIWAVIEAGAPVMNINTDVATALPPGVKSMSELSGWKEPVSKTYEMVITNSYDFNVIEFRYRVISVAGGSLDGEGHYIGYATVQPEDVYVAWGWNFDAHASAPAIYNTGSKAKPIGSMNFLMDYNISTPFNKIRQSQSYFISGKGELKKLD
jgi:hypothetical protein